MFSSTRSSPIRLTNNQASESEKYPPKIRKLFTPKLPFLHKDPIDYPPSQRATPAISPISAWRLEIEKYRDQFKPASSGASPAAPNNRKVYEESLKRQLLEWEDTDAFAKNEFIKDPYKTVFVARLYYSLTELDVSKHFNKYGTIESVRIVRHKETGKSRGYGFVVFEREEDASNCIRELAPTGLAVAPPAGAAKPRKILVDMERGRLARNWRPRRLGGGLGGRHYTSSTALSSRDASAASSGRRLNLSSNPYQGNSSHGAPRYNKRPGSDFHTGSNKRHTAVHDSYRTSDSPAQATFSYSSTSSYAPPSTYVPTTSYSPITSSDRHGDQALTSMKDRYARYQRGNPESSYKPSSGSGRSIRTIRQKDS